MGKFVLGIDNGGTMSKAAIYDLQGNEIAVSSKKTKMIFPEPGHTERDLNELWDVNTNVIKEVIEKSKVDAKNIVGVSVTAYGNGIHFVDEKGKPTYNGVVSTDTRAKEYVKRWQEDGTYDEVLDRTMQSIWAGQTISLLAWFKDNEPTVLERSKWILTCTDYIRMCLTGEAYAEITNMSGTNILNVRDVKYDREILEAFGVEKYENLLPPIKYSTDICGSVTNEAARLTGLMEGTPVSGGMFDIDACSIATGVTDSSKLCLIAGTWSINEYISDKPIVSKDLFMTSLYCMKGYWLVMEGSTTSASNFEWFVQQFLGEERARLDQEGESIYSLCNEMVESIEPENQDIVFLPFLYGTNADANAKSCFIGMSGWHTRAHMIRSIYEGIVFSHMLHVDKLMQFRDKPEVVRISGGAAKSRVWVQIFADVLQTPVEVTEGSELGTLGAALCAATAVGEYESCIEAADNMVSIDYTCQPREEKASIYAKKYERFKKVIDALAPVWDI